MMVISCGEPFWEIMVKELSGGHNRYYYENGANTTKSA